MKKLFFAFAVVVAFVGCVSTPSNVVKCEIVGRIDNYNALGQVYLVDRWNAHKTIDSAKLEGNTFHFKSVEHTPTFAMLMLESGRPVTDIFIESGKVLVSGDYNIGTIKSSGTPANDAFSAMMIRSIDIEARRRNAIGAGEIADIEAIEKERDEMLAKAFEQNRGNVFGLFMLQQLSHNMTAKALLDNLSSLTETLQQIPLAGRMKAMAERRFKTEPQVEGSSYVPHYIDIVQPNLNGEEVSLKSVVEQESNRYILLDFWASWSRFSEEHIPFLKRAYEQYKAKGFEIYSVSLDTRAEFWEEAVNKYGMSWINVSTLQELRTPAAEDYAIEVTSLPTNFLIDGATGVIVAKNLRGEALLKKLEELFK